MEFDVVQASELPEIADYCKSTLETLLTKMGFTAVITPSLREKEGGIVLDITECDDLGLIIGKDGGTLRSLQTVLRVFVMKKFSRKAQILLDADHYLLKREEAIKDTAYAALHRVEETLRKVQLRPMNSLERRIVHTTLEAEANVHTYSIGDGANRRVVIAPGPARAEGDRSTRYEDEQPAYEGQPSYAGGPEQGY